MTLLAAPKTVLVVDECASLCELIQILLVRAGYHVRTAANGKEALRLSRSRGEIDLLLVNLDLPEMRGEELAARFVHRHPATAVAFLSDFAHPATAAGPHELLVKPFTVAQLRATVHRALQARPPLADAGEMPCAA